jgi:hypothetical protein
MTPKQPIRIVAFVGTANGRDYAKATYTLGGVESDRVPLVAAALCSIANRQYATIQSVELLGTREALAYYETGLFTARELLRGATGRPPWTTPIEAGGSEDALRAIFMAVHTALAPQARPELGETEPPRAIWFDTTHGFRAQSFLGAAALAYTLSDWSRKRLADPPEIRVFYAYYDDLRKDMPQPIWELTEFVTATRWNAALDALVRFGRADDVLALAKSDAAASVASARDAGLEGRALAEASFPSRLGKAAQTFADDLTMIRLRDLFTKSSGALARIVDATDRHYQAFLARRPYLEEPLARLRELAQRLAVTDVLGHAGLRATAQLAHTYGELQQFAAQMVAVREGVITAYGIEQGLPIAEPGQDDCDVNRKAIDDALGKAGKAARTADATRSPAVDMSMEAYEPRNDVMHGGIRRHPGEADRLRKRAQELSNKLQELAKSLGEPGK